MAFVVTAAKVEGFALQSLLGINCSSRLGDEPTGRVFTPAAYSSRQHTISLPISYSRCEPSSTSATASTPGIRVHMQYQGYVLTQISPQRNPVLPAFASSRSIPNLRPRCCSCTYLVRPTNNGVEPSPFAFFRQRRGSLGHRSCSRRSISPPAPRLATASGSRHEERLVPRYALMLKRWDRVVAKSFRYRKQGRHQINLSNFSNSHHRDPGASEVSPVQPSHVLETVITPWPAVP